MSSTTRPPLSRALLLEAAVAVADAEGLQALTMRRLGAEVGAEAMSLYHHLPGKEGLLDGLAEQVLVEAAAAVATATAGDGTGDDWRAALRRRCLAARTVMVRHPWAPGLLTSRSTIPAVAYSHFEGVLATLVAGGFSYHLAHRALHALGSMPLGFVQEVFSPEAGDADEMAEADLAAMAEALPHLTAMVAAEVHDNDDDVLGWCDSDTEFAFTLDLLLDGLVRARDAGAA